MTSDIVRRDIAPEEAHHVVTKTKWGNASTRDSQDHSVTKEEETMEWTHRYPEPPKALTLLTF